MGGKHTISIGAAVRNTTELTGHDPIRVTLTIADIPVGGDPLRRPRYRARGR